LLSLLDQTPSPVIINSISKDGVQLLVHWVE
jgi:hypothetical protein